MATTKIEFAVPMSCQSCVDKVSNVLNGMDGIKNFEVDFSQERVVVESSLPIHQLQAALETSGKRPGPHGFHIYSSGDLSQGCDSIGDHYNPYNRPHGGPNDNIQNRHLGDLGNILSDESGRAAFRIIDKHIKVHDVIGRSVAVTAQADDLGRGSNISSKMDGNSGERIGCGIIARSAGILENTKRICLCSGVTLWDEKGATS
ncbi:Copper chaperone for super oxide dismutase, CCS1 [Daphnia magna]|uniref:Superoxide dismutase [Cu-Zn] n=1 Tax=Daphnia magna TaxID=35525 RepID=A0A165ABC6_9CRUS|nr:Copper chaperone for super oxide dismutase, CCS1 [Daphnia magna]